MDQGLMIREDYNTSAQQEGSPFTQGLYESEQSDVCDVISWLKLFENPSSKSNQPYFITFFPVENLSCYRRRSVHGQVELLFEVGMVQHNILNHVLDVPRTPVEQA